MKGELHETLFCYEVIFYSRASTRVDSCVKSRVSSLFSIPVSFDSFTLKQFLSLRADVFYSFLSQGKRDFFRVKRNSTHMRVD